MIKRKEYIELLKRFRDKDLIKVITGIRRCGKSTMLSMFIDELKKDGVEENKIITINLEDLKYSFLTNYMELYNFIDSQLDSKSNYYIFIDEVQNIKEFQRAIDSLYIKKNVDLYITGSNSNLLSGELATLLSGRYVEIQMLPLSFKEYKESNLNISEEMLYQKYISIGSFPYVHFLENEDDVSLYLGTLYNDVIIKDVMSRNSIKDESTLKKISNFMMDNIGNLVSTNNITNVLKSDGVEINVRTVEKYLDAFCKSYFLYKANRYDIKGKRYLKTGSKYYVVDIGMRYFLTRRKLTDFGHIAENIVYLELLRRGYEVYIGSIGEYEIDFVAVNREEKIYIQVAETLFGGDIDNKKILNREERSLKKIKDNYKKLILTLDRILKSDDEGIEVCNLYEWLLDK